MGRQVMTTNRKPPKPTLWGRVDGDDWILGMVRFITLSLRDRCILWDEVEWLPGLQVNGFRHVAVVNFAGIVAHGMERGRDFLGAISDHATQRPDDTDGSAATTMLAAPKTPDMATMLTARRID